VIFLVAGILKMDSAMQDFYRTELEGSDGKFSRELCLPPWGMSDILLTRVLIPTS
jgi:hypothetical protein